MALRGGLDLVNSVHSNRLFFAFKLWVFDFNSLLKPVPLLYLKVRLTLIKS